MRICILSLPNFASLVLTGFLAFVAGSTVQAEDAATAPVAAPAVKKSYDGTAEISSIISNGNTKNQTTGLAGEVNYKPEPWILNLKSKYLTTTNQDVLTQELFEASGRGGHTLSEVTEVYIEESYLKNRFAGVENRFVTSGGLGYFFVKTDAQSARLDTALGYTQEDRTIPPSPAFMSGVLGLSYKLKMSPTADFSHETKYLPNFHENEDWRLTSETSISAAMTSLLSSKISWKYEHVNVPPAGKVKGDTVTSVSILAKF